MTDPIKKFNSHTFNYKRHLTRPEAEAFMQAWSYEGDDEFRFSRLLYKKASNDYTVVYGKYYNS